MAKVNGIENLGTLGDAFIREFGGRDSLTANQREFGRSRGEYLKNLSQSARDIEFMKGDYLFSDWIETGYVSTRFSKDILVQLREFLKAAPDPERNHVAIAGQVDVIIGEVYDHFLGAGLLPDGFPRPPGDLAPFREDGGG